MEIRELQYAHTSTSRRFDVPFKAMMHSVEAQVGAEHGEPHTLSNAERRC